MASVILCAIMAAIRLTTSVVVLNASYCVGGPNGSRVTAFVFLSIFNTNAKARTRLGPESHEEMHHNISTK